MAYKRIALLAFLLASTAFGKTDGGIFLRAKTVGIQPNMTVAESNPTSQDWGNVLLSQTIYTTAKVDSLDTLYTGGIGTGSYTSPDSAGAMLGYLPSWEFIGTTAEMSLFVMGTSPDSFLITAQQAMHYSSLMKDSDFVDYGFQTTDTLFVTGLAGRCSLATASAQGDPSRQLYDTLRIRSPYVRFRIKNLKASSCDMLYFYIRRQIPDIWIEGAAGRLMKPVRQ
jgi:hypothetical protein